MIKLGELIVPLMNLLHETQVSYDVMQMDETTVQVLKEDGRAAQTKSRMWVRRGGAPSCPVILFDYKPTRSGAVAWRLLEDFKGILQSDGYSGYIAVGKRDMDRGRNGLSPTPPSEPSGRFSRTRLSSRWFLHRDCLADCQAA